MIRLPVDVKLSSVTNVPGYNDGKGGGDVKIPISCLPPCSVQAAHPPLCPPVLQTLVCPVVSPTQHSWHNLALPGTELDF